MANGSDFTIRVDAKTGGVNILKAELEGLVPVASQVVKGIKQEISADSLFDEIFKVGAVANLGAMAAEQIVQALKQIPATIGRGIQEAASFEELKVQMGVLLGSETKAVALMGELKNLAASTPLEMAADLAPAAKQLSAFGFAQEEIVETTRRLGDVASGLGIPLQDLAYLYGTTRVQGRLFAEDLNQFTQRGIPLIDALAQQFGVAKDEVKAMVSEGEVGFADVEVALQGMTSGGGPFAGMMARQAETWNGLMSTIRDGWSEALRGMGDPLLVQLKPALSGVAGETEAMAAAGSEAGEALVWIGQQVPMIIALGVAWKVMKMPDMKGFSLDLKGVKAGFSSAKGAADQFAGSISKVGLAASALVLIAGAIASEMAEAHAMANRLEAAMRRRNDRAAEAFGKRIGGPTGRRDIASAAERDAEAQRLRDLIKQVSEERQEAEAELEGFEANWKNRLLRSGSVLDQMPGSALVLRRVLPNGTDDKIQMLEGDLATAKAELGSLQQYLSDVESMDVVDFLKVQEMRDAEVAAEGLRDRFGEVRERAAEIGAEWSKLVAELDAKRFASLDAAGQIEELRGRLEDVGEFKLMLDVDSRGREAVLADLKEMARQAQELMATTGETGGAKEARGMGADLLERVTGYRRLLEQVEELEGAQEEARTEAAAELELLEARLRGEEEVVELLRRHQRLAEETARMQAEGLGEDEARAMAEHLVNAEEDLEAQEQRERADQARAGAEEELEILRARVSGEEAVSEELERQKRIREEAAKLEAQGLDPDEAQELAGELVAGREEAEEAQEAQRRQEEVDSWREEDMASGDPGRMAAAIASRAEEVLEELAGTDLSREEAVEMAAEDLGVDLDNPQVAGRDLQADSLASVGLGGRVEQSNRDLLTSQLEQLRMLVVETTRLREEAGL